MLHKKNKQKSQSPFLFTIFWSTTRFILFLFTLTTKIAHSKVVITVNI
jgi:hypothetical protein